VQNLARFWTTSDLVRKYPWNKSKHKKIGIASDQRRSTTLNEKNVANFGPQTKKL